jgi:colicin import membrane protein
MTLHHSVANESSVLFNLRQLMELEEARVQSEAEATREAELAARERVVAVRAREERAAAELVRARAEELRRVELEAARIEQEREAALLRVRLEAEARGRAELERLALERERLALERAHVSRQRATPAVLLIALAAAAIGAGSIYASVAPQPKAATGHVDKSVVSASLFTEQARELEVLRAKVARLTAQTLVEVQRPNTSTSAATATPKPRLRKVVLTAGRVSPKADDEIDLGSDDRDPIWGLEPRRRE